MSKILEAIDKYAKMSYPLGWNNPAIRQYLVTGDEAILAGIPNFQHPWVWGLAETMPAPKMWTEEAARLLTLAYRKGAQGLLRDWLQRFANDSGDRSEFDAALSLLRLAGLSDKEMRDLLMKCHIWNGEEQKPTPAGHLVLEGSDAEILNWIKNDDEWELGPLLAHSQPDRLQKLLDKGLKFKSPSSTFGRIVEANPARFAATAFKVFQGFKKDDERLGLIYSLSKAAPGEYLDVAIEEVRSYLRREEIEEDMLGRMCVAFMLEQRLPDALELACKWMAQFFEKNFWNAPYQREMILKHAAEHHPEMILPMAQACARCRVPNVVVKGLSYWRQAGIEGSEDAYHEAIQRLLAHSDPTAVVAGVSEARGFDVQRMQSDLWPLMEHKSRPVRSAAARTLASLGFASTREPVSKLLGHKKSDIRQNAVILLGHVGGEEVMGVLKQHLDVEEHDDVRDSVLIVLEQAGSGASFSPDELQARIAKTLAKSKAAPAPWINVDALVFKRTDGSKLSPDEALYLLIRQSRCKEMRADLEARPLLASLDRTTCSDCALVLLEAFLGSGQDAADRWVLAFAALTGDDRLVPVLRKAIIDWADKGRGKLAEYGAQALALLGTDAALMVVDSLSVRFRTKNKNIGQAAAEAFASAAEARGVTVEELGDLVVPWLGFEPGKPRLIETVKGQVEARIAPDFKLGFRDVKSGKPMAKLPSGVPAGIQAEFKTLSATLKEAVKAQLLRLETLLVRQFRWPMARWRDLYLAHPLLKPFTQRLVWGWWDAAGELRQTFRALEDSSLTDIEDNPVILPDEGSVGVVHPLDIEEDVRSAWVQHLVDYDIVPPFAQLERPVNRVKSGEASLKFGNQVLGTEINAMTFRSRAEKLGWSRGSVADAGCVTGYRKVYSGAGVEAFIYLEGMFIGIGMEETIKLGDFFFVKSGSVRVGSYSYDEPRDENDSRLIAFGEVPEVPFSETMGDLIKISGKTAEAETAPA